MGRTPDTNFNVTGLKEGEELQFRVTAENKAGLGKSSDATDKVVVRPPYGKNEIFYTANIYLFLIFLYQAIIG